MDGRGLRNRRRTAALLAASFFTIALLAPTGTHAQIYIPPPDDLIEPQPALPPAIDPGQPPPATPPPSAPATMTWDEAKTQARDLGSSVRGANQGITNAPGAAGHYHLYWGDDRARILQELTNWPTYYPANLSAGQIVDEMLAH